MNEARPSFLNRHNLRQARIVAELALDFIVGTASIAVFVGTCYQEFVQSNPNGVEGKDIALCLGSAAFSAMFFREGIIRDKELQEFRNAKTQQEHNCQQASELRPDMVQLTDQAAVNSGSFIKIRL